MCEGCVIGSDGSQQRHGTDIDSSAHFLDTIYEPRAFFQKNKKKSDRMLYLCAARRGVAGFKYAERRLRRTPHALATYLIFEDHLSRNNLPHKKRNFSSLG